MVPPGAEGLRIVRFGSVGIGLVILCLYGMTGCVSPSGGIPAFNPGEASSDTDGETSLSIRGEEVSPGLERLLHSMKNRDFHKALEYLEAVNVRPGSTPNLERIITLLAVYGADAERAWYYCSKAEEAGRSLSLPLLTRRRMAIKPWPEEFDPLPDRNISSLLALSDDLWVGTWNGGFLRVNMTTGTVKALEQSQNTLAPRTVRTMDRQGESLWVGTYTGLYHYWLRDGSWRQVSTKNQFSTERIQDIISIGDDVYISTLGWGLWKLRNDTLSAVETETGPGRFITLVREIPGKEGESLRLVGTMDNGAWLWNQKTGEWSALKNSPRNINALEEETEKRIWFGSYGGGVVLWDRLQEEWIEYTNERGELQNDWILTSCQDEERIYWGTFGGGLTVYQKETREWYTVDLQGGLHSQEISALESDGERLYTGSLGRGVRIVYPERYEELILNH